jgi:hypothetical protein
LEEAIKLEDKRRIKFMDEHAFGHEDITRVNEDKQ